MPLKDPEALKAYKAQYYVKRRAFVLAQCRQYREANKGKVLERQRAWNERNKERVALYKAEWLARNPDHKREYAGRPEVQERQKAKSKAYYQANKDKVIEQSKAWREANPERKSYADWAGHLRRNYGITIEDYERRLVEQDGKCAICGEPTSEGGERLAVDHDHETGKIRALLCRRCNSVIGFIEESAALARLVAGYLEKHK
jgi:hypothetical protein